MRIGVVLVLFLVRLSLLAESVLLSTIDGGFTWTRENSGISQSLNAVSVDPMSGLVIAVGDRGTILRREVGGSWEDVSPPEVDSDLRSVAVGFDGVCMACGDSGTLMSSFNRGVSWRVWDEFGYENIDLLSVNFDPSSSGSFVITGEGGFLYASSDGITETGSMASLIGSCVQLCSSFPEIVVSSTGEIYFFSGDSLHAPQNVFSFNGVTKVVSGGGSFAAVGDEGLVCSYTDGCWRVRESNCTENLFSVAHITYGRNLCAVGENGTILISTDGGESWASVPSPVTRNLNGVAGSGSGTGYIVGDNLFERYFP
jgi:photosystem II stability/assembly factor-like uncharacterized protein